MHSIYYILLGVVIVIAVGRRVILPKLRSKTPSTSSRRPLIKNHSFIALRGLTIASLKMYFRNRTALFFSLFFPIVFIVVFGSIFKDSKTSFKLDLTNQSQ